LLAPTLLDSEMPLPPSLLLPSHSSLYSPLLPMSFGHSFRCLLVSDASDVFCFRCLLVTDASDVFWSQLCAQPAKKDRQNEWWLLLFCQRSIKQGYVYKYACVCVCVRACVCVCVCVCVWSTVFHTMCYMSSFIYSESRNNVDQTCMHILCKRSQMLYAHTLQMTINVVCTYIANEHVLELSLLSMYLTVY